MNGIPIQQGQVWGFINQKLGRLEPHVVIEVRFGTIITASQDYTISEAGSWLGPVAEFNQQFKPIPQQQQ